MEFKRATSVFPAGREGSFLQSRLLKRIVLDASAHSALLLCRLQNRVPIKIIVSLSGGLFTLPKGVVLIPRPLFRASEFASGRVNSWCPYTFTMSCAAELPDIHNQNDLFWRPWKRCWWWRRRTKKSGFTQRSEGVGQLAVAWHHTKPSTTEGTHNPSR